MIDLWSWSMLLVSPSHEEPTWQALFYVYSRKARSAYRGRFIRLLHDTICEMNAYSPRDHTWRQVAFARSKK